MTITTIKITELDDIGSALDATTLIPVVNMTGTPTTEKAVFSNVANAILGGAGIDYVPVAVATLAGTVTTSAQPNITSIGTLTNLSVAVNTTSGNVLATSLVRGTTVTALDQLNTANLSANGLANIARINVTNTANLGAVGNVTITGGTSGYVLSTNGSGGLSWVAQTGGGGSYGNSDVANYLPTFTGNVGAGNVIATANLYSAGLLSNGVANINSNVVSTNYNTGALKVRGGAGIVGNVHSGGEIHSGGNVIVGGQSLFVGPSADATGLTNPTIIAFHGGTNYIQAALKNSLSTGSADWVAYGDNGTDNQGWADFGFTSSAFDDPAYTITGAGDGYFIVETFAGSYGGNLVLATGSEGTVRDIIFATNGFDITNEFARISDSNNSFELTRTGASLTFPDGSIQTTAYVGGGSTYGNSNVASYLPTYTGNVGANWVIATYFSGNAHNLTYIPAANINGTVANANLSQYLNITDVNNNFSYHVVLSAGAGDKDLHIDADDNLQYNPADGTLTATRVDATYFVGNLNYANGYLASNLVGSVTGNVTFNDVNIIGDGNLNLQPDPANSGSYLDIFLTSGPDLHLVASAGANLILGKDDGANVMTSWDGNVTIQSWSTNTDTQGGVWTFDGDGTLTLPNDANIATIGNVTQFNTCANGFLGLNSYDAGGNNIARVGINSADTMVSIGVSDPITEVDYNWSFNNGGGTVFPTLTVDLHNGGNQQAQTLQFGDSTKQAVITGPTPPVDSAAQRLIIQGQRGSGLGEGGDVYVWGGDSDVNGGDIKIYAGDSDGATGGGGYINLSGGQGADTGGYINIDGGYGSNGSGGYINITGGTGGNSIGGNIQIQGGQSSGTGINGANVLLQGGYSQSANGGAVTLRGGQSALGLSGYGNVLVEAGASTWSFDNSGVLTVPGEGVIQSLNDTVILQSKNTGTGNINSVYLGTSGGLGFQDSAISGNWLEIFRNSVDPQLATTGNLLIRTDQSNTAPTWTFGNTGMLTFPDNTQMGTVEGANTFGFYNNNANTEFLIELGSTNVWSFNGTSGNLTVPGNVIANNIKAEAPFSIQNNNFNATAGSRYGVNTSGGAVTATLPATPETGVAIFFADAGGAYASNNLTIDPNGGTIMGASGSMTVSTNNQSVGLFYNGTTWRTYNAG